MLKEALKDNIRIVDQVLDWKEAIQLAASPLKEKGMINDDYIQAMIDNVVKNGSYIVISPGFAIPHSRPEHGVLETGLSLLKLMQSVEFPEEKKVQVLVVLAAKDSETHMELISELAHLIMEEESLQKLFSSTSMEEVLDWID